MNLVHFRDFLKPLSCLLPEFNELPQRLEGFTPYNSLYLKQAFFQDRKFYLRGNYYTTPGKSCKERV